MESTDQFALVDSVVASAREGLRDDWEWKDDVVSDVIVALADARDRLAVELEASEIRSADLLSTLEHSATHKALAAMAAENGQLRELLRRWKDGAIGVVDPKNQKTELRTTTEVVLGEASMA